MAKKKAKAKKKPAKKRSGMTVTPAKSGKRKKAKKKRGFLSNPGESLKSAFMAAGALRAAAGGAAYIAKKNNKGEELPKVKMIVPALVTAGAYAGALPSEYLFAGATAFTFEAVDNTKFLKDIFDFNFLDDLTKPKSGLTVRQIPQRMLQALPARSGVTMTEYRQGSSTLNDIMADRSGGNYNR